MSIKIHDSAVIDNETTIEDDVTIGPNCIIGPEVIIKSGVNIGPGVIIDCCTTIDEGCKIFPHAVLGSEPQDIKFKGGKSYLEIGKNTIIREFVTVNRGTVAGGGLTSIGSGCFLMAYVHIAHDCHLGDNVILANAVNLAGHIEIAKNAIIGGLSAVHQFVKIGEYAFIGGCSALTMDVPPYAKAVGNRACIFGINSIGLRRSGFSPETIAIIKKVYHYIISSKLNTSQALKAIETEIPPIPEVQKILDFICSSKRGICKGKSNVCDI